MSDGDNLVAGDWDALQKMFKERGVLHDGGNPVPLDYWEAWQGKKPINPDGTIKGTTGTVNPATGMVDYKLQDDSGFLGEFLKMAQIPLTFAGFAMGANGITNWLNSGGLGGLDSVVRPGDASWGVNPQGGGMDYFNTDSILGNSGAGGVDNALGNWNVPNGTFSTTGPASGAFPGYDFGLGYPVGGDLVTNLAGGGLTAASSNGVVDLIKSVYDKIPAGTLPKLIPSALGMLGSAAQNKALEGLVGTQAGNRDALLAFGSPYRQRLAGLYDNPSSYLNSPEVQIPVQQGTDAMARALSVQGNPIGNGTALQELQNYSANQLFGRLGQEKDRLAGFGGLTAYNQAGAQQFGNTQAQQALAQGQGNMWNALGYGLNQVLNPQPTMADLARQFGFGIQGLV